MALISSPPSRRGKPSEKRPSTRIVESGATTTTLATSAYEFAMLYGIQESLQQDLARAHRRVRVLLSYGAHWFPWYMRRLAERPANIWFVVRNLVTK